ncbi:MAG: SPOR domain-containing protein [Armatimonadota bacterium]|nr:SPOR domain-containing protein [Armatimonadota bacterium]MDR7452278.1 SPOR domain-containing protein [Armatimonadota bacterium]MDR7467958.1 SPOR domain-containing protein [Armatimonadota bacterium]MDR7494800.1 SPOR domain-containing protein [Armatimonadota bacterium]MDR7499245.1 SPOR domain-containing protein [Armatimonadota bacterium]
MATWEEQPTAQRTTRLATNWSLLVGLISVFLLSAGTLAATRLPAFLQSRAPSAPPRLVAQEPLEAPRLPVPHPAPATLRPAPLAVRPGRTATRPLPAPPRYVIVFGTFADRAEADTYARLVRSKGYLAGVTADGGVFHVVSRPYDSRQRARFWTSIFLEIGLDAGRTARVRGGDS